MPLAFFYITLPFVILVTLHAVQQRMRCELLWLRIKKVSVGIGGIIEAFLATLLALCNSAAVSC
jgi:hypothetical protein